MANRLRQTMPKHTTGNFQVVISGVPGAPHGVATLKIRKGAFDAFNKGSGVLGKVKLSPHRGRPLKNSMKFMVGPSGHRNHNCEGRLSSAILLYDFQ